MLKDKYCIVTGSKSMIGRATVEELNKKEAKVFGSTKDEYNLLRPWSTQDLFLDRPCEYLFMLAGYNGGLAFNKAYPYDICYRTMLMGINTIEAARVYGNVKKILFILPSCALEPQKEESFEEHLYTGPPHQSVECHGYAKRSISILGRQLEKQYGIKFISVICNNSFGPYDHFNEEKGKVISGLIRRFVEAKENNSESISIWGTGNPLREFIYCKDVAKGLVQIMENYDYSDPINLTSDFEISIRDLAFVIKEAVGYEGDIIFDTEKPDGQMRKKLNSARMSRYVKINFTPFEQAIKETVDWYLENKS